MNAWGKSKGDKGKEGPADGTEARDADFSKLDAAAPQGGVSEAGGQVDSAEEKVDALVGELRAALDAAQAEAAEAREKYMRTLADFDNARKRSMRERSELLKYQGEMILVDLLEVVDDLELALQHADADPAKLKPGLQGIVKKFTDTLTKWEVKGDSGIAQEFDPAKFMALSQVPVDDAKPGTIINSFKKAYFYKDKLIRPGQVVVAGARPKAAESVGAEGAASADKETP